MKIRFFNVIIVTSCLVSLLLGYISLAQADCALVLTSPEDGAVFTGANGSVTIYGYVKANVDPGYGYI